MKGEDTLKKALEDIRKNKLKSKNIKITQNDGHFYVSVPKFTKAAIGEGETQVEAYVDALNTIEDFEKKWI